MLPTLLHVFKLAACGTNNGALPGLYDGLNCDASGAPQINSVQSAVVILANVVRIMVTLAGALAVIFIIVGAIFYVTSMGSPDRIKRAKQILTWAVGGLVLVIAAYAIVTFVAKGF